MSEKIKLTVGQVVAANKSLGTLINQPLPFRTAFKLRKNIFNMEKDLKAFEETRKQLIAQYGQENEKGEISVKKECFQEFVKKMDEILLTEIEVELEPVPVNDLSDVKLSVAEINSLCDIQILKE